MLLMIESSGLIEWGGFILIIAFVFAETGFLLGLVIPGGETLLFTAGLLVSTGTLEVDIVVLMICTILAALSGDTSGYFIGRKFRDKLYRKQDTWYFRKKYLRLAEDYIHKHKKGALIFGKFLPIIRPFAPAITGTTKVSFPRFFSLTLAAVLLYVSAFTLSGYFLGSRFPKIKDYLGFILPVSILVALVPVIVLIRKNRQ